MITYDEALSAARVGNALFFLGAGFSIDARNSEGEKLPNGQKFKKILADKMKISSDYNLDVISQHFIDIYGESELLAELKRKYIIASYVDEYNMMAVLGKAHIYTTNYDDLVEQIFSNATKKLRSFTLEDNCKSSNKGSFVLHINGKIENDTTSLENIRLTLGSYDTDFTLSPWIKYLSDDLKSVDAIFIIGHSLLADADIRRLVSSYKDKCFIIQHPEISDNERRILSSYGNVCENGVIQFIKDLSKATVPETSNEFAHLKLNSFRKLVCKSQLTEPSDQEEFDFFIKGDDSNNVYYQNIHGSFSSLINRHQIDTVCKFIEDGKSLILHSNLGNGKSIFLKQVAQNLKHTHFLVYQSNYAANYHKELKKLSEINERIVLVYDPYNSQYDSVSYLKNFVGKNIQFVLIARSAMHENMENRVNEDLSEFDISTIDLNILNKCECEELNLILERYGLWGKDAALSNEKRLDVLTKRCKSSLQEIILYLFDKCDLKKRFEELIKSEHNKQKKRLLILSFINSVIELGFSIDDFNVLFDEINVFKIYTDKFFKEFAYSSYHTEWRIKSPIVAKAMLNSEAISKQDIIKVLIDLTLKLDNLYDGCDLYINALKHLSSCSYLAFIFDYEIDRKELLDYYEAVKSINFNRNNYFFWMQYAIACVNTQSYERAERYFETAYSFAQKRGRTFSTFQIDNHYARFLLERQIFSRNPNEAFVIFMKAHMLLIKSKRDAMSDDNYYQFRVARNYREYYNVFYDKFTTEEQAEFIKACQEIKRNLNIYEKDLRQQGLEIRRDVDECKYNIDYILKNYLLKRND